MLVAAPWLLLLLAAGAGAQVNRSLEISVYPGQYTATAGLVLQSDPNFATPPSPAGPTTWMMWIRCSSYTSGWTSFFGRASLNGLDSFRRPSMFLYSGATNIHFRSTQVSGPANQGHDTVNGFPLNAWTHLAFMHKAGDIKIYYNATSQALFNPLPSPITGIGHPSTDMAGVSGIFGCTPAYAASACVVRDVRYYPREVTQSEVLELMATNPSVTFVTQPAAQALTVGGAFSLACRATAPGGGTVSYTWLRDGVTVGTAGPTLLQVTYSVSAAQVSDSGSYVCRATGAGYTFDSAPAAVVVWTAPAVTSGPTGATIPAGGSLTLSCAASGSPTPTISWFRNGASTGATGATYQITGAAVGTHDGSYTCVASHPYATSAPSAAAVVFVQTLGPASASAVTANTLSLQWVAALPPPLNTVAGYTVTLARDAAMSVGAQSSAPLGAAAVSHQFASLESGADYYARVTARFTGGAADVSGPVSGPFRTLDPDAPGKSITELGAAARARTAVSGRTVVSVALTRAAMVQCLDGSWTEGACAGGNEAAEPRQDTGLLVNVTLSGDLTAYTANQETFVAALVADLAAQLGVPASRIRVTAVRAGSIVVDLSVSPDPYVCDVLPASETPDPVFFRGGVSGIVGGDLVMRWDANHHYSTVEFDFIGATSACFVAGAWSFQDDTSTVNCGVRHTQQLPVTTALRECGFSGPTPVLGSATNDVYYETTAVITTVQKLSTTVFGTAVNRTNQAAQVLRLQMPGSVNLTAGPISVFPAFENLTSDQANFAAITTQTFNTTANRATVRLVTSAAWPYVLTLQPGSPLTGGPSGLTKSASEVSAVATTCDALAGAGQVCTQDWNLVFEANTATQCTLDGTYTVRFNVRCSLQFGNGDGCPALQNSVTSVVFDLRSDNFCARVIEVANVQPSLEVYASPALRDTRGAGTQVTDATSASTLFYRFDLVPEAGLRVTSVALQEVVIVSGCSECVAEVRPVVIGAPNNSPSPTSSYGWQVDAQTAGERLDFQFQLNDNSLSFDNNDLSGQTTVSVFVSALVNYTSPDGQQAGSRLVRLQSSSPSGSAPTSASTQFSVSSAGAGPSGPSSSASSSTVLGVSQGVVAAACVGLAAIVVVGVAVAVRRRRHHKQPRRHQLVASSSSAAAMSTLPAAAAAPSVSVPVGDLRVVQGLY